MKTNKYFSMAVLAIVGAVMTSCSSDNNNEVVTPPQPVNTDKVETLTVSVSMGNSGAGTRALDADGHKTFAVGDKIAVVYKNTSEETVKATSVALTSDDIDIAGGSKSADFTVTLTNPDKTKNVTYIYPAAMAKDDDGSVNYDALTTQDGTLATLASSLDYCEYTGAWSGENLPTGDMANQFAICALTLKDALGSSVITSSITSLVLTEGSNKYTVSRSAEVAAAAGSIIYVAIRPTSDKTINFLAGTGTTTYAKYVQNKTYVAGKMYKIGLKMAEVIGGKFTVDDSGNKVYFSPGNLQATGTTASTSTSGWTWSFATNQWDKIGNATANTSISGNGKISANGTVDLFGWSTSATYLGINNSTDNTKYLGEFSDWGSHSDVKASIGTGWRTLNGDEWYYLFLTRDTPSGKHYCKAKVNGVFGVILLPDDWNTSYYTLNNCDVAKLSFSDGAITDQITLEDWNNSFVPHGAVFLPTTGHRYKDDNTSVDAPNGRLYYWSSTKGGTESGSGANANQMYIGGDAVSPNTGAGRRFGSAVRLVYPIK